MKHRSSKKVPEERSRDKYEDLKAENKKLRKQVLSLRKELSKMKNRDEDLKDIMEEYQTELEQVKIEDSQFRCPKCQSLNVTILENIRPGVNYYSCGTCSARGPIK